ncbi:hypothetical protein JCM3765_007916 [Sporobolomyces pararoseus]
MSTETTNKVESTRIDYLSRLPPELLYDIFDYAYSSSPPPPMPLSKSLLHFHQKHFYRQLITLSSPSSLRSLLFSISNEEEKGQFVNSLKINRSKASETEMINLLEKLFPLLPKVKHLKIYSDVVDDGARSRPLLGAIASFRSLSTAGNYIDLQLDVTCFAFLSALPNFSELTIEVWPRLHTVDEDFDKDTSILLSHIKYLRICGSEAYDGTVYKVFALCPNLSEVALYSSNKDSTFFDDIIWHLPSGLKFLKLSPSFKTAEPIDSQLLRFTNLRSLDLGAGCYSKYIHSTLQHLPLLVEISLGGGPISPLEFIPLVSGPTRLVHLEIIYLDYDPGSTKSNMTVYEEGDKVMKGWRLPEKEDVNLEELEALMSVAESNGVEIWGDMTEMVSGEDYGSRGSTTIKDYWTEKSNRAILSAYKGKDEGFKWLKEVRTDAAIAGVTLPSLSIDSLDPERLELVKIDQPGRDWDIFSLRNKEPEESAETK